jgi:hypothetical protein
METPLSAIKGCRIEAYAWHFEPLGWDGSLPVLQPCSNNHTHLVALLGKQEVQMIHFKPRLLNSQSGAIPNELSGHRISNINDCYISPSLNGLRI